MNLADLLLDQTFVARVANKYKSELLFICNLYPFISGGQVSPEKRDFFRVLYLSVNLSIQGEVQTPQSLAPQARWAYGFYLAFYLETYEIPYL